MNRAIKKGGGVGMRGKSRGEVGFIKWCILCNMVIAMFVKVDHLLFNFLMNHQGSTGLVEMGKGMGKWH